MRRKRAVRKDILPDPKHNSKVVTKLVNMVMFRGKKAQAERIVYTALDIIEKKLNKSGVDVLKQAVERVRPLLEVKPRRVGGATYQVPVEIKQERGTIIALRWIRNFARQRKGRPMEERLAQELMDAFKGEGLAMKKREDTHKMAESNRAFAHYRW